MQRHRLKTTLSNCNKIIQIEIYKAAEYSVYPSLGTNMLTHQVGHSLLDGIGADYIQKKA